MEKLIYKKLNNNFKEQDSNIVVMKIISLFIEDLLIDIIHYLILHLHISFLLVLLTIIYF